MRETPSSIADALRNKRKLIVVHGNADVDAVGTANALAACFPPADILAPNGIDRVCRTFMANLGIGALEEADADDYDLVVVVDTSSPEQLTPFGPVPEGSVVIDHHKPTGKWAGVRLLEDRSMVSCAQLALDVVREGGAALTKDAGLSLLCGMLTDGGRFMYSDARLLRDFAWVMENVGIEMDEAVSLLNEEPSISERVAVLKTVARSKFERVSDMVVATAVGGTYEASSCRALLYAGADVAFVASQKDDAFRMSSRATQKIVGEGIDLGGIMGRIGSETDCDGGGHSGAAGASGKGDAEAMLHMCQQIVMDQFRKIRDARDPDASE